MPGAAHEEPGAKKDRRAPGAEDDHRERRDFLERDLGDDVVAAERQRDGEQREVRKRDPFLLWRLRGRRHVCGTAAAPRSPSVSVTTQRLKNGFSNEYPTRASD